MSREYEILLLAARREHWSYPMNDRFGEQPWIDYWNAMIDLNLKIQAYWKTRQRGVDPSPDFGRPVPPH